ncbi:MAG: hypothetical protein IKR41_11680 [Bacteroidales bacterium]|nr:hypothetical protein [Bacteroidales bacterium]
MIWYNECDESNLRSNWSYMDGRSQKLTHYKGVEDGNPSGNTDNIKYIRFYDSLGNCILTRELRYDAENKIIQILAHPGDYIND